MRVEAVEMRREGASVRLSASVDLAGISSSLWFRWRGRECPVPGDALLVATLPVAMAVASPLFIDAPLSPEIATRIPQIQRALREHDGKLPVIDVRAADCGDIGPLAPPVRERVALWFDSGVTAFQAFQQTRAEVDALVCITDHTRDGPVVYREGRAIKSAQHRATDLGKPLIGVETNLREWSHLSGSVPWMPALCATVAQVLAGDVACTILPPDFPSTAPARGFLDAACPGPGFRYLDDEAAMDEARMVQSLAADWRTLEALRVCWENPQRSYNCGRCSKCTRNVAPRRLLELLARESRSRTRQQVEFMNTVMGGGKDGATETA